MDSNSIGVGLEDQYLDEDWNEADKSPKHNCYVKLQYKYHITDNDLDGIPFNSLQELYEELELFLGSMYFENDAVFSSDLMAYKCMFAKIVIGIWKDRFGKGGDGKGLLATLEKGLVGPGNFPELDASVLCDRNNFRKSAHFAWNKLITHLQENPPDSTFVSDIWKRMPVNEMLDLRVNFGFTVT
jgi:hypothetical protein